MALKTLKGVEKIGGFDVVVMDDLKLKYPDRFTEGGSRMDWAWFEKDIRPKNFIYIRNDVNSLSFTLQSGPVKEVGVNGCQVDTVIETAKIMLEGLNQEFPCEENTRAIMHLSMALEELQNRRLRREERGVEGFAKA